MTYARQRDPTRRPASVAEIGAGSSSLVQRADEALTATTRTILASGWSVDVILAEGYVLYVFEGDWLHNAVSEEDRAVTEELVRHRIRNKTVGAPGDYVGGGTKGDELLLRAFASQCGPVNLVDVGGNYGLESIRYRSFMKLLEHTGDCGGITTHVIIEPAHAGILAPANLALHGFDDALIVAGALGAHDRMELFYFKDGVTPGGTLLPNVAERDGGLYHSVPVQVFRWDALMNVVELEGPTFFKIDVQGAEAAVLEGAREYLEANACAGICEFSPLAMRRSTAPAEFVGRWAEDFDLWDVGRERDRLVPLDSNHDAFVADVESRGTPYTDVLFAHRSLAITLPSM